jgi:hypothetical protein
MPILVSALLEQKDLIASRHRPVFEIGRELSIRA